MRFRYFHEQSVPRFALADNTAMKGFLFFFFALFISTTSSAQQFTATPLGDYGNVTVMEVTGNYDADNPDEMVNSAPRQAISKEFFKTHKDEYDFLVIFTNFDFKMPYNGEAIAFYNPVKNDTQGLGHYLFDNTSFFGSDGKLQGVIDMGDIAALATDPLNPNFRSTLHTLSHELMHRWGSFIKHRNNNGKFSTALLGLHQSHWSYLFDSGGSTEFGNSWQNNGNGTFTSVTPYQEMKLYGPLDLYLMGMIDKSQVPPMLLIENPAIDPTQLPEAGVTISGIARTVTIDDIIAANGPRVPDAASSQKSFKTAFIFVTRPGTFTGDDLYGIENIRNGFVTRHSILTDGQSIVEVASTLKDDVPTNPGILPPTITPRTLPPSINEGVQWLMSNQQVDGSWSDTAQTTERDTALSTLTLRNFTTAALNYQNGALWLAGTLSINLDYLARKVEALVGSGQDVAPLVQEILSRQNADGGWGSDEYYASNSSDTALALRALFVAGYGDAGVLSKAIGYLKSNQSTDGSWGSEDNGGMVQETANVLSAFIKYQQSALSYQLNEPISQGKAWLIARQNADGGFGNSPSTVYDTAVATMALGELDASANVTSVALAYLLGQQAEDGGWNASSYQTALAVNALLKGTIDPDLSITSNDITIIPATITRLPSNIVINADISNLGQTGATAKVVLYDGNPTDGTIIGEQTLMFPGQSSTAVTFAGMIQDGSEYRFTLVIDPDNQVSESNKLNNTAVKTLSVEATYDFEGLSSDITISPNPADMAQDVTVTAKITNTGTMNAYNVQVKYYLDIAGAPFDIATQTVDIPAGATITNEFTWRANKVGVDMPLTVQVDPFGNFEEVSETNNMASTPVTVNADTRPNLTISYTGIVITPSPANEGGSMNIAALVRNEGSSAAVAVNVSFYQGVPGADGLFLGEQTIPSLAPGESVSLALDWMNIPEAGEKIIYLQIDPATTIPEIREDDNDAFTTVMILSLPDLALATNSITFYPAAPKEGDPVLITVTIQNKGEQTVSNVLVRLSEDSIVFGNQTISSLAGNATGTVSISYDTIGKKGAHTIAAIVDPDNAIVEQSNDNNSASRTFGVQDSSLWVTEQFISPNGDGVKDSTELFFRLEDAATVSVRVVNKKSETVRSFTGPDLVDTTVGSLVWDGLNDSGVVVADGNYHLQILNDADSLLGTLQVTVDNNRSPLTDAIGTPYLLNNNLTCTLPNLRDWRWSPDESGILINIPGSTEYLNGLYTVSPDGADVVRLTPDDWNDAKNLEFRYSYSAIDMAPDGETIVFGLTKYNIQTGLQTAELWAMDGDGSHMRLLDSIEDGLTSIYDVQWSPAGDALFYLTYNPQDGKEALRVIKADGTGMTIIDQQVHNFSYVTWSSEGSQIVYVHGSYDAGWYYIAKIIVSDIMGNKQQVYNEIREADGAVINSLAWLNQNKLILSVYDLGGRTLWLVNPSGNNNHINVGKQDWNKSIIWPAPGGRFFSFTPEDTSDIAISDSEGNIFVRNARTSNWWNCVPQISDIVWSTDGGEMAFSESLVTCGDCPTSCNDPYGPHVIVVDANTKQEQSFALNMNPLGWMSGGRALLGYTSDEMAQSKWPLVLLNLETGESSSIPMPESAHIVISDTRSLISPYERYISYYQWVDSSSVCAASGYEDLWVLGSLLNLTADLRIVRNKSAIILKGIAVDLNFSGYQLEYADAKSLSVWNPVAPPSDIPVINEEFTTWVPPYEGIFYVRLTVWDRAGNTAIKKKRVSWGHYSSITNLYKSREIFSPNNDGVKDTVELHYRVLEPVHLEFTIYDDADNLVKTYYKDHAAPTEDFIQWDGTDEAHNTVPDGKYKIKVFDYEFFVEVDNTPPDVEIYLSALMQEVVVQKELSLYRDILGHAVDNNLKNWVLEYGEGENPQVWNELDKGERQLVEMDNYGNPILNPIKDVTITGYTIEWFVNKKLRLTVEDFVGNKRSHTTDLLPEEIVIYSWIDGTGFRKAEVVACGDKIDVRSSVFNKADIFETIKNEIQSLSLQFQNETDGVWRDIKIYSYPLPEYKLLLSNSQIDFNQSYLMRIKATDVLGAEYYSNVTLLDLKSYSWEGQKDINCPVDLLLSVAYDEAECNSLSRKATLLAAATSRGWPVQADGLSFYMQKPEGLQLLRYYDLKNEKWDGSIIDAAELPEGTYPVKVVLNYSYPEHPEMEMDISAENTLVVERLLPAAQITYPTKSAIVCPENIVDAKGDWYGLSIEGIAMDNNNVQYYELYYGEGENPAEWLRATTRINGESVNINDTKSVQGSFGVWDVTELHGTIYSLKLRVVDIAGNVSCYTTSFTIKPQIEISNLAVDKQLFSPNNDGVLDDVTVNFLISEYAVVDIKVFKLLAAQSGYVLDNTPVRTISSGIQHLGGTANTVWDGMTDGGTVASDGKYGIAISVVDACGNTAQKWVPVEIDNTLPATIISYPTATAPLGNIIEVKGTADDLHFQGYILEAGQGASPETWMVVSSRTNPVVNNILGTWNTFGLEGVWTLKLSTADAVGNTNSTLATIDLGLKKDLIKNLDAVPQLFSPNSDGKLDATDITYELTDACEVQIDILDSADVVKRTYTTSTPSLGIYTYTWDGKDTLGAAVLNGAFSIRLSAVLKSNTSVTQTETITVVVDTVLPTVDIKQPADNSYSAAAGITVNGTISDLNLSTYSISNTGESGSSIVDQANQSRENYTFGILNDLAEGSYTLNVLAKDLGENTAERAIAFTIDRTAPVVKIDTPKSGEYYGTVVSSASGTAISSQPTASINITGSIIEKNLDVFNLRYGLGDAPTQWTDLVTGNTITAYPSPYSWKVGKNDGIPDGQYSLSLYAKDKAGLTGEAKVKVIVDNTPPTVAITAPVEGGYVKSAIEVKGTAFDQNLDKYTLEISEGQCASAFKWAALKTATASVQDGVIANWQALPSDGDYCLRVTATDKVGSSSESKVNIKVDTTPPTAPVLSGKVDSKINGQLDWTQNTEPDLAGYNLYRGGQKINAELISGLPPNCTIGGCALRDENLTEGVYLYSVKAVDLAGWESEASNEVKIKIDLTGPDARIRAPQDGVTVSDIMDIKGTAYSEDDFKQYRVSIGQGASPAAWNIIRTSPLPTSYGVLAQWDTLGLGEGQVYAIKLEAEDISGNVTKHQISVEIDNASPGAPLLISVNALVSDVTVTWQENIEADLAGYLLYRNDQLANVTGIVVGDMKPYLIQGTSYLDKSLPDGTFKYYLIAMDQAGNMSELSSTLTVTIDTHPPHAVIVDPADTSKFGGKIMVKAESPDLDTASVQFQYQSILSSPTTTTDWLNIGSLVTGATLATYMDPVALGLTHGDYRLRAVATDKGQKTDPTPGFITITYTDLTAPAAPTGLSALVSGGTVSITWTAGTDSDLAGYNVYRDGQKVTTAIVSGTELRDENLADGLYSYTVTAVDTYQNESKKSSPVSARVYAPVIVQPSTPTALSALQVQGTNATGNSAVEITVAGDAGYELRVTTQSDAEGKFMADAVISMGLNTITALATDSSGNMSKTSNAVTVVYDEAPATPTGLAATALASAITLTWNQNVEPDLDGYNVFRNTSEGWEKISVSLVTGVSYAEAQLPNGTYLYRITAVDAGGNESVPSQEVSATVSVTPPDQPADLSVIPTPEGGLNATWIYQGSPVAGYVLYRSMTTGGPYTKVTSPRIPVNSYLDTGLTSGTTYYYVVTAVDLAGNESGRSNEASGIPLDMVAPSKPVILMPTMAGAPISLFTSTTTVSGTADPDTFVDLFRNGDFVVRKKTQPKELVQNWPLDHDGNIAALSPDGKTLAYTLNGVVWLKSLVTGTVTQAFPAVRCYTLEWSADGSKIAYTYVDSNWNGHIGIYDEASGGITLLPIGIDGSESSPSWSADGARLIFVKNGGATPGIGSLDVASGTTSEVVVPDGAYNARISPDGKLIAYSGPQGLSLVDLVSAETRLVDSYADTWNFAWSYDGSRLAFVSYQSGIGAAYVLNVAAGTHTLVPGSSGDPYYLAWTGDGQSVAFVLWDASNNRDTLWTADVHATTPARRIIPELQSIWSLSSVKAGTLLVMNQDAQYNFSAYIMFNGAGFEFSHVELSPGENIFTAISSDAAGNTSPVSDAISVTYDVSTSPDLVVSADEVYLYPPYPIAGERMAINAVVSNVGQGAASAVDVTVYAWNALGQLELLKSERVDIIPAGDAALITATWDSTGKTGDNRIVVVVDPDDTIAESLESNNMAIKDFSVTDTVGLSMSTSLDRAAYGGNQAMAIDVIIRNSGPASDTVLETRIEDENGYPAALFEQRSLTLAYAYTSAQTFAWNTGETFAGAYQVHTLLKDAFGALIAENTRPFSIVSNAAVDLVVVTDRAVYGPNEKVATRFAIMNTGTNTIIPAVQAVVSITDANGTIMFSEVKTASNLLPGASVDLSSSWNTGLTTPGDYQTTVVVSFDGGATITRSADFLIGTTQLLTGTIKASPSVVANGNTTQVLYTVANSGNADAPGLLARITILDPETQTVMQVSEEAMDLPANANKSSQAAVNTTGYGLKTYTAVLQTVSQGIAKTMASTPLIVKDLTPPLLTISSPASNVVYSTAFSLSVLASDNASGVDRVEYQVDSNAWQLLPVADVSQGRYAATWAPVPADNGSHTISFQAFDKAGNTSAPIPVTITIQIQTDTTPPLAVIIGAPASLTNVRDASLTITGEDVITYKYNVDSGVFSAETSTLAPIVLSGLLDGPHTVLVAGRDTAGNWQKEEHATQASWTVDFTPPALIVSTLPDGSFTNNPLLNVAGTASDANGIQSLVVSGQTITITTSDNINFTFSDLLSLATGSNIITTVATDHAGNSTMDTRTIILDLTAPVIMITNPADNSLTNNADLDVTGFVDQLSTVSIKLNGVSPLPDVVTGSTFTFPITLDYDLNHIDVTALDLANNTGSAKRTITMDNVNPGLAVTSPSQDMGTSQATIELSGTVSDLTEISLLVTCPTASVGVVNTPTSTTWSVEITNMQQGTNTVRVQAVDEAGNSTSVIRNIIHSATPVTIDPVQTPTNISQQKVTGTMVPASTVTVNCDTAIVGEVSYPTPTTWQVILANMTEGPNSIGATATDLAEYTSDPVFATILFDAHAPTTTPGPVPGDYYNSVTVSLTADEPATIYYTTDGSVPTSSSAVYTGPLFLTATTTLSFFAVDSATNAEAAKSVMYTVILDVTPPVTTLSTGIPNYASGNGTLFVSSATGFTLSATDDISGVNAIGYRLEAGAGNTYTAPFSLVTEGSTTIGYWSTDNAGNEEQEKYLTVLVDNMPPVSTIFVGGPPVTISTPILITAIDTASGVQLIEYAIDSGGWTTYSGAFTLALYSAGTHTINYRSTDNIGHVELTKGATITLIDLCADAAARCNDNNACTDDACDPMTGDCGHPPVADGTTCNDEDMCSANDVCIVGVCTGTPVVCNDNNACTGSDQCDPATGLCVYPLLTGTTCDDDKPCTSDDVCASGTCTGTQKPIDDNNVCTADACDPATGFVTHTPTDGLPHTPTTCGVGQCASTGTNSCVNGAEVDSCTPGTPAAEVCNGLDDDCDGAMDEDLTRSTTCGVGVCTGNIGSETCTAGAWGGNTCGPLAGATAEVCDNLDNDCDGAVDDGLAVTPTTCGVGQCASAGTLSCVNGAMVNSCTSGAPGVEVCNGLDDDCDGVIDNGVENLPCNDEIPCTINDLCVSGVCSGTQKPVDDSNPCTIDACDLTTGTITHTPVADGTTCDDHDPATINDSCTTGQCRGTLNQYTFTGFFNPVDNPPSINKANAGQAIPIKWRLTDANGVPVSDPASFKGLTSYLVSCGNFSGDPEDAIEEYAPGSSGLIYNGAGNWHFNWKTPKSYAKQCRIMVLTLGDNSTHTAQFRFK